MSPLKGERLQHSFSIHDAGKYTVTVKTNVTDAIPSAEAVYIAKPLYPPHQLVIIPEKNGSYVLYWQNSDNSNSNVHDSKR